MVNRRKLLAGLGAFPLVASPSIVRAQAPLKIGYVYVGPAHKIGWSYAHDQSRLAIEAQFGDRVQTFALENVPEGPIAEEAIADLASDGHQLIFTTSFGYMRPTIGVAQRFPDVFFEHCSGFQRLPNVSTYNARFYEGRAVLGTIMARVSKSGIGGYIGGMPIPEVYAGVNATILAARAINPDFRLKLSWVNSWFDPEREAAAAHELMDKGADVLTQHTDSIAPLQAAASRNRFGFGQAADMSEVAPAAHLTALVYNWAPYCVSRVQAVLDGNWSSKDTSLGLEDDAIRFSDFGPGMTPAAKISANSVRDQIANGLIDPFAGPILDQSGRERVAGGAALSAAQILELNWLADGVDG